MSQVGVLSRKQFKAALINYFEAKTNEHRFRQRMKSLDDINFVLFKMPVYADKLNYLDQNIEATMREFTLKNFQNQEYAHELKKVRGQLMRNQKKMQLSNFQSQRK